MGGAATWIAVGSAVLSVLTVLHAVMMRRREDRMVRGVIRRGGKYEEVFKAPTVSRSVSVELPPPPPEH